MKKHIKLEYPALTQINLEDRRLYEVPGGNRYPSATTVIGSMSDGSWLESWKAAVGEEEATRVSRRATNRGTAIHGYCEDFLNNKVPNVSMFDIEMFNQLKFELSKIDNVYAIEVALYSHKLKTAGTVDLIAEYNGELAVIDWKTSNHIKSKSDIPNYFIQTSFYAFCMWELFRINIPKLVIIMAVDGNKHPLVFEENTRDWIPKFVEVRKQFKTIKGY